MVRELMELGVEVNRFAEDGPIPKDTDLVWDPGMCMRRVSPILAQARVPLVGTMHGVKTFSVPLAELAASDSEQRALARLHDELREDWRWFGARAAAVVAVSDYAAAEVKRAFRLPEGLVRVVPNGVDHTLFRSEGEVARAPGASV